MLKKQTTDAFLQNLKRACHWLNIGIGRTRAYVRLLEDFDRVPRRTHEHILAYYESCEIVELLELWETRNHQFPGLKAKLQTACWKVPVVTEDEKITTSSNKPRNDVFVYLMAGKFLATDISVGSVDEICPGPGITESTADFSFRWNAVDMNVECKRVNSPAQLPRRAKDARNQILRTGRCGIIAIDCSLLVRPSGTLLETESPLRPENEISRWLEHNVVPQPADKPVAEDPRLHPGRKDTCHDSHRDFGHKRTGLRRRDCISSTLAVGNGSCSDRTILQDIAQRLRTQSRGSS